MDIVVVSRHTLKRRVLQAGPGTALVLCALVLSIAAAGFAAGFRSAPTGTGLEQDLLVAAWQVEAAAQRARVDEAVVDSQRNLDALAARVAELQARVMRLDALGSRMVEMASLDEQEFGFDTPPGVGGPAPVESSAPSVPDFVAALDALTLDLEDRLSKLRVVESALIARNLEAEVLPSGRPVRAGWMSSLFGNRSDPMNGRKSFHAGVDFAGRAGSDILAVASGVVVRSGTRQGYGRVVEIDHGNGYSTIYAHNRRNHVRVGDTVRKGDVIAEMGASGRATGTHVHFEVLRHGRPVNPLNYVRAGG